MSNLLNVKRLNDKGKQNFPRVLNTLLSLKEWSLTIYICSFCNSGISYEKPRFYY